MTWIIGLVAAVLIILRSTHDSNLFLNAHSLEIVLGGAIVVLFMMTPSSTLKQLLRVLIRASQDEPEYTAEEIREYLKNPRIPLKDTYGLISLARDLTELGCEHAELRQALIDRADNLLEKDQGAVGVLRNLGKYPPALGMLGTVIGMIHLFSGLGSSGGQSEIGSQLAVAMTATLYGLILSNLVLVPLADRLATIEDRRRHALEQTIRLLLSVFERKPFSVAERVVHAA